MYSGLFIGMALGVLLQRGQFCFVSGFRRIYTQRNFRFLTAFFWQFPFNLSAFLRWNILA